VAAPRLNLAGGAAAGVLVWAASYFGWARAFGMKPANEHPARRNAIMIGAHVVWGVVTAAAIRELVLARRTMLAPGPLKDRA
jgi:hypothetical protein